MTEEVDNRDADLTEFCEVAIHRGSHDGPDVGRIRLWQRYPSMTNVHAETVVRGVQDALERNVGYTGRFVFLLLNDQGEHDSTYAGYRLLRGVAYRAAGDLAWGQWTCFDMFTDWFCDAQRRARSWEFRLRGHTRIWTIREDRSVRVFDVAGEDEVDAIQRGDFELNLVIDRASGRHWQGTLVIDY